MKNKAYFTLAILLSIATTTHVASAYNNIHTTADMLTKTAYTQQAARTVIDLCTDHVAATSHIPSTAEILAHITSLQNAQGRITHEQTRQHAIQVLQAAIIATHQALARITQHHNHQQLSAALHLQHQKLQSKLKEIDPQATWSYRAQYSNYKIAAGCIAIALIATGIAYYLDLLPCTPCQEPIIIPLPSDDVTQSVYKDINIMLNRFLDPTDKAPLTIYVQAAKDFRERLLQEPEKNAIVIDVLETVIESENRMDYGFRTMEQIKNDAFWVNILIKRKYYTSVFHQISQRDIDDIDFKQLWRDKGWM